LEHSERKKLIFLNLYELKDCQRKKQKNFFSSIDAKTLGFVEEELIEKGITH